MNILVTGGNGLVGNGIRGICLEPEFSNLNIIFVGRNECNLLKKDEINRLIDLTRPDAIIHTAARVGGIGMNISTPSEQYYENIIMNTELIESAYQFGVNNLICFSSVCAFPSGLDELSEDLLHKAEPYPAHRSYAYAKRMVDIQIESYRNQYGSNYCSVIPGNIFGKNDNFNLENGHVIPSLIHRCYLSKINNEKFEVWGDGEPQREFIYSEDIARACLVLVQNNSMPQRIIMSGRKEHKIKDVVNIICNQFDHHDVTWLKDKPNGQMRRPSNKKIFDKYLPDFKFTDIEKSIGETTQWFKSKYPGVRK